MFHLVVYSLTSSHYLHWWWGVYICGLGCFESFSCKYHHNTSDLYHQQLFSLLAVAARVVCVVFWWRGPDQDVFGGDLRLFKNLQFCTYTNEMIHRYFSIFRISLRWSTCISMENTQKCQTTTADRGEAHVGNIKYRTTLWNERRGSGPESEMLLMLTLEASQVSFTINCYLFTEFL